MKFKDNNSLSSKLLNGFFYTALAKYSGIFVGLIITGCLARLLTPFDFGIIAIASIFINFFSTLTTVGIGPAIVQNKELTDKDLEDINSFVIYFAFVLTILFLCSIPIITRFYDHSTLLFNLLIVLSVSVLTAVVAIVPNAMLMKNKQFKFIAKRTLAVQISMGVVSVIIAYCGGGAYSLLVNPVLGNTVLLIVNFRMYPIRIKRTFNFAPVKKIFSFSMYQMLFNMVYLLYRNVDKIIIGKYFSVSSLGYYEKSYRLMLLPLENISGVISPVLHPVLSDYQNDKDYLWNSYLKILRLLAEIGFFLTVLLYFSAPLLIHVIYGYKWAPAIPLFQILSLSAGFQCMQAPIGAMLQSINRVRGLFFSSLIVLFLVVVSLCVGVYFGSLSLFCWCLTISFIVTFFIYQFFLVRYMHKSYREIFCTMLKPIASNIALFAILFMLNKLYANVNDFYLFAIIVLIMLSYQYLMWRMGFLNELKETSKKILRK